MASASVHIMNLDKITYDNHTSERCSHINAGSGKEVTIKELAETIKKIVEYKGQINFDPTKPDGSPRKLIDSKRLNGLGFQAKINLENGLLKVYQDFIKT